jgi:hypothetical protein
LDGGAFTRSRLDFKPTAHHFQTFPHAQQPQVFAALHLHQASHLKGFAVILYFHRNLARQLLDVYFYAARLCVSGDIRQCLLCNSKKHGALDSLQFFHPSKGGQLRANAGLRGKAFHEGAEGGNQSEIIQHRRPQFARELMHDVHRFFHQPLCLGDDTMQFAADAPPLFFLRL